MWRQLVYKFERRKIPLGLDDGGLEWLIQNTYEKTRERNNDYKMVSCFVNVNIKQMSNKIKYIIPTYNTADTIIYIMCDIIIFNWTKFII